MFSIVIDDFLKKYQGNKHPDMFKKHNQVLPMLREIIGNKPINELKQADINGFFELLELLPTRWIDECRKRKLTLKQLAELEHPITLGLKSFEDTYKACVRAFLKIAKKDWQDQGFPTTLTIEGIKYQGDREEGENTQRAFTAAELKRLFKGGEMEGFAIDPAQAHCYWLPHIGLFTGARVNEICQLNPQVDILQDVESGIWYLWITEETDGDHRILKSTKNKISRRKVPIHSILQKLGFLNYVEQVKKQGAKLLFPAWKPMRGKASGQAEKWFRKLIKDTGLRDDTPYARIVGMHAFRHTLLTIAKNANPRLDATSITGHAGEGSAVVRGYEGELSLGNKKRVLEALPFGLDFNEGKS
ncbi:MAG: site-specific integrase [Nitrosospira sp.]